NNFFDKCSTQSVFNEQLPNTACTGQVRAFRPHFRDSAPNSGFGVWWLFPPSPALAGNANR
ncbi:MAG: hypothetical protein MUP11_06685, partial [Anaerolineales bacterium]|nr:hypothetical protein [Anaerolineales bacterium]